MIYKLQLFSIMKIYLIMFIIQLKSKIKILNPYKKTINIELSFIYNKSDDRDVNNTKIKRIIDKKITRDKSHYLLK